MYNTYKTQKITEEKRSDEQGQQQENEEKGRAFVCKQYFENYMQ